MSTLPLPPRLQWEAMIEEDENTDEVIWDKKGKGASLRIATPIKDTVHLSNMFDQTKKFVTKQKEQKNLTDVQIAAGKKDIFKHTSNDHEAEADARETAATMVKKADFGSAGNAFQGQTMDMNLEDLVPPQEEKEESDEEEKENPEAEAGAEKKDTEKEEKKKKKTKRGWFDRDTSIAGKVRAETTALCTLKVQLEQKLDECRETLQDCAGKSSLCQEEIKVEQQTLGKRVQFLEAVLQESSATLQGLIAQYDAPPETVAPTLPAETATATSFTLQMSTAPPCQSFRLLKTLASMRETLDEYWKCQETADLKEMAKARAQERKPLSELCTSCNAGLRELKRAVTDHNTRAAKLANPKASAGNKKKGAGSAPTSVLFEFGPDKAEALQVVDASKFANADTKPDFSKPFIYKLSEANTKLLNEDTMKTGIASFKVAFQERIKKSEKDNATKAPEKRSKARAASKLAGEVSVAFSSFFQDIPSGLRLGVPLEGFAATSTAPQFWGVQNGAMVAGAEPDGLASCRLILQGTRMVLASSVQSLCELFGALEPSMFWKYLMEIKKEDLEKLTANKGLYSATYSAGEMYYLPAGWVFCERVLQGEDLVGLLQRGLTTEDQHTYTQLQVIRKCLTVGKKDDTNVSEALSAWGKANEVAKAKAIEAIAGKGKGKKVEEPKQPQPKAAVAEKPEKEKPVCPIFEQKQNEKPKAA